MITCSAEFKALWHKKVGKADYQRVGYKRRYKAAGVYQNEAAFTYLERPDFISLGDMPQQIDAQFQNIVRISVITITFPNLHNEWIETTVTPSFFAADEVATAGYKAYKTIWIVQEGVKLSDGTIEWITVFTGLGMSPRITGGGAEAQVDVSSYALLLETADAEAVSEEPAIEDCIPAVGDASRLTFESTSTGVDHDKGFFVDDAGQNRGLGYRVSNANEVASAGNTGRLLFTAGEAPGNLISVKCQVFRWLLNKSVDYLLGALATAAGITSGMRTIVPIIFPGGLSGSKTVNTQDEWEAAATSVNAATAVYPGSVQRKWFLIDDFSDNNYSSNPVWTVHSEVPAFPVSAASGALSLPSDGSAQAKASTPFSKTVGTWRWNWSLSFMQVSPPPGPSNDGDYRMYLIADAGGTPANGYYLAIRTDGSATLNKVLSGAVTVLASFTAFTTNGSKSNEWRVTRSPAGDFEVFLDGVSVASGSDSAINLSAVIQFNSEKTNSSVDDIYWSEELDGTGVPTNADCELTFIFDLLSAPSAMGVLEVLKTLNGGSLLIKSAGANDLGGSPRAPGTFDALVERDASDVMQSATKEWLKLYVKIIPSGFDSPQVHRMVANFSTTDVFVSLANHRGRNVLQQMEQYVALADYELRFRANGNLYIGPKDVTGDPALTIDQENGFIDCKLDTGIPDRVVRGARVRYQGFVSKYDDVEAGIVDAEVLADGVELGDKYIDQNLDGVVAANDLNIGDSRARLLWERGRRASDDPRPPLRLDAEIWDAPWLEVSDIIRASYYDHPIMRQLVAFDELFKVGPYANFGDPQNVITASKDWKLIYYNPNKDTGTAKVLLEEIPA